MGDLDATRVEPADEPGRFTAKLSADWNVWSPNGGYVASVGCGRPAWPPGGSAGQHRGDMLCRPAG